MDRIIAAKVEEGLDDAKVLQRYRQAEIREARQARADAELAEGEELRPKEAEEVPPPEPQDPGLVRIGYEVDRNDLEGRYLMAEEDIRRRQRENAKTRESYEAAGQWDAPLPHPEVVGLGDEGQLTVEQAARWFQGANATAPRMREANERARIEYDATPERPRVMLARPELFDSDHEADRATYTVSAGSFRPPFPNVEPLYPEDSDYQRQQRGRGRRMRGSLDPLHPSLRRDVHGR